MPPTHSPWACCGVHTRQADVRVVRVRPVHPSAEGDQLDLCATCRNHPDRAWRLRWSAVPEGSLA